MSKLKVYVGGIRVSRCKIEVIVEQSGGAGYFRCCGHAAAKLQAEKKTKAQHFPGELVFAHAHCGRRLPDGEEGVKRQVLPVF
ncbi:MAG: hypothetical protein ABSF95_14895 [Verrucomicrobiota bacterium]